MVKPKNKTNIIIPQGVNIWHHELLTAEALANSGVTTEFLKPKNNQNAKSADLLIDGEEWEIKSPSTNKLSSIERNLKRASKQSENIIIDSCRINFFVTHKLKNIYHKNF